MANKPRDIGNVEPAPRASQPGGRPEDRPGGMASPSRRVLARAPRVQPVQDQQPASEDAGPSALWDVHGVAAYLQIPVSSIYKMTAAQSAVRIPHIRIGGKLRFRRADVDQWLTLLTVSNLDVLARMRKKVSQVSYGDDSQASAR
jgi:excisionase family DNA binding protein